MTLIRLGDLLEVNSSLSLIMAPLWVSDGMCDNWGPLESRAEHWIIDCPSTYYYRVFVYVPFSLYLSLYFKIQVEPTKLLTRDSTFSSICFKLLLRPTLKKKDDPIRNWLLIKDGSDQDTWILLVCLLLVFVFVLQSYWHQVQILAVLTVEAISLRRPKGNELIALWTRIYLT